MELNQAVELLWTRAIAKRTRNAYDVGFNHFKRFLLLNNVSFNDDFPPVSEEILIYFVTYCYKMLNLQYSTIKLYLSGIRHNYLIANHGDPLELYKDNPCHILKLILNSVKRLQNSNSKRVRLPINIDILEKLVDRIRKLCFF